MSVAPSHPAPPALVAGRYRVLDVLGAGGMGVVYRAFDDRLRREVALKLVDHDDPDLARRLHHEADLLAELNHPHIVQIFDAGEHEGRPYIVTSLVEGESLRAILGRGPLPSGVVAALGRQVAGALAAAHRCHIVHRDLKPDNILVSDGGFARLLDFGIAQRAGDTALTAPGSVIGTAAYLSPEQLSGRGAVAGSDVYSLALVLLEALTGRPAFPGTLSEAVGARLVGPPPMPTSIGPSWRALLDAMTAASIGARPPADAVAARLAEIGQRLDPVPLVPTVAIDVLSPPTTEPAAPFATTALLAADPASPGNPGDLVVAGDPDDLPAPTAVMTIEPTTVLPAATAPVASRRRTVVVVLAAIALAGAAAVASLAPTAGRLLTGSDDPTTVPTVATTVVTVTEVPPTTATPTTTPPTTPRTTAAPAPPPSGKGKGKGKG